MLTKVIKEVEAIVRAGQALGVIRYHLYVTGKPITYVGLAKVLGWFSGGKVMAESLGLLMLADKGNNHPLICSAVVGSNTHIPGPGYFKYARQLGFKIANDTQSELKFWKKQVCSLGSNPDDWAPEKVERANNAPNDQIGEDGSNMPVAV